MTTDSKNLIEEIIDNAVTPTATPENETGKTVAVDPNNKPEGNPGKMLEDDKFTQK